MILLRSIEETLLLSLLLLQLLISSSSELKVFFIANGPRRSLLLYRKISEKSI